MTEAQIREALNNLPHSWDNQREWELVEQARKAGHDDLACEIINHYDLRGLEGDFE